MVRPIVRRSVWLSIFSVLTLLVAGLMGAVVRQSWITNSSARDVVQRELDGAAILHPLTTLLSDLVQARSSAVRGQPVDAETLHKALGAVATLDAQTGARLQTTQPLATLTDNVNAALAQGAVGRAAYDAYSGLITLCLKLENTVGDTSHLVHDPDLDSYYVMDAAIVQLPDAMIYAGTASDLVALSSGVTLQGDDQVKAAVARYGVSAAAEAISTGLSKSINYTSMSTLGTDIADRLDAFKTAADEFAPPTMLRDLSQSVSTDALGTGAGRVFAAANPFAHQLLGELQTLLRLRAETLASQWKFTAVASGAAGLIGIALIWMVATVRPGRRGGSEPPVSGSDGLTSGSYAYAREMLNSDLVHAGRDAQPSRSTRGRGDAL